jgi:glucan phosphoethanolaminetransferase (alkaline phosphatase superfamily)
MKILYIDIDSLRPDHLGCHGYHRNTSPNIDRLAERGTTFTNYYASDVPCAPSRNAKRLRNQGRNEAADRLESRHEKFNKIH